MKSNIPIHMATPHATPISRRTVLAGGLTLAMAPRLLGQESESPGKSARPELGPIHKAVKISMIRPRDMPVEEKFKLAKEVGFKGITLFAPDAIPVEEAIRASEKTGLRIHNINGNHHWQVRLSDPDPKVRAKALENLKAAIRYAHAVGATSTLLIVGKVTDPQSENHEQVWERSITQIRKAIPLAAKLGVHILCENVRNGFCPQPRQWAAYLDEIGSPWVGAFYDIGNSARHAPPPEWIEALGTHIVKLDMKGFSSEKNNTVGIGAGTIDWKAVRASLADLRFTGWATAEVRGGGRERLREVAENIDRVLSEGSG